MILGVRKHPHLHETEMNLPQNAASTIMDQVGGWYKVLGTVKKIKSTDQVDSPSKRDGCGRLVHHLKAGLASF